MSPLLLRQLWSTVEDTQSNVLINLDDSSLIQRLLGQFKAERALNSTEVDLLGDYIRTRLPLIRDLAQGR